MRIGDCLEEIRKIYGAGSTDFMNKVGLNLIYKLKYSYFGGGEYPRQGWLLFLNEDAPWLVRKNLRIKVDLSLEERPALTVNNPALETWKRLSYKEKLQYLKQE